MSGGYCACTGVAFWFPLVSATRALRQLPVVLEKVLEEVVAPVCRLRGPGDFEAAANCITCDAGGVRVRPAEALLFDGRTFGLGTHVLGGNRGSVGFAERVTTRDQ